jgi:hypothetical protein
VEDFIVQHNPESLQIAGASEDLMITRFIQGVHDEELIRQLHGPDGMSQTMDALMVAAKMYVKAEKSLALARSLEKWHHSNARAGRSAFGRGRFTPRRSHGA